MENLRVGDRVWVYVTWDSESDPITAEGILSVGKGTVTELRTVQLGNMIDGKLAEPLPACVVKLDRDRLSVEKRVFYPYHLRGSELCPHLYHHSSEHGDYGATAIIFKVEDEDNEATAAGG